MDSIDVFIGGPMGNKSKDGTRLSFDDHTKQLAKTVEKIAQALNPELERFGQRINLLNPLVEELGSISSRVFSMIDRAEVGIFVLSSYSPSAMYELTLMHALGKPVVPVAFTDAKAQKLVSEGIHDARALPHYLRDEYGVLLNSFSTVELRKKLEPKIRMVAGLDKKTADTESNPISRFYGLPLVDVSATTGLATGYFVNFLRFQLRSRESVFARVPHLQKFVILRPRTFDEVGGMLDTIKRRVAELGLEVVRIRERDGKIAVKEDEQVRGEVFLDAVGPYVFDIPAPITPLKASPRYIRILDEEKKANSEEERLDVAARRTRLEQAMISSFFGTIRKLSNGPDFVSTRLEFKDVAEFVESLRQLPSGS